MKKMTFWSFIVLVISFMSFSCELNFASSNDENSSTSEISSINESLTYEKDEEGFFILDEKDYYQDNPQLNDLSFPNKIEDYPESTSLRLYSSGEQIPLYNVKVNASNTWTPTANDRVDNSVGYLSLNGKINLVLATNFTLKHEICIRPLAKEVDYQVDQAKRLIYFTIIEPGQYTIEFRLNRTLHLFVDEYGIYEEDKKQDNVIYFAPGIHNKDNDSRINNKNEVVLYSNQTLYLDYGAVLQGSIVSNNAQNVTVIGGGIISGATFDRNASTNTRQIPIDFNFCNGITFKGISLLDPAGWTYNLYFCNNIIIDNSKIISSRSNGDGISLQSCSTAHISNCFVRTWDDSLVVKNYPRWDNSSIQGTTKDIYFNNCLLWTDLAQCMEIGYETVGKTMNNINFEGITILHANHKAAISIHNGNNADVKDVTYKNIVIEDASMGKGDGSATLFEFTTTFSSTWSNGHGVTELGSIDNVKLENIKVLTARENLKINIIGCIDTREGFNSSIHKISNIEFNNIEIYGENLNNSYAGLNINQYAENINFI